MSSISIAYDKDVATVCIKDTGMGIPTDAQKHLFEKFYRVDNSATRETGGTGLGLFITRTIIESFGGKIWLESQVGDVRAAKRPVLLVCKYGRRPRPILVPRAGLRPVEQGDQVLGSTGSGMRLRVAPARVGGLDGGCRDAPNPLS